MGNLCLTTDEHMKIVGDILSRKRNGIDCTEYESAEIKQYLIKHKIIIKSNIKHSLIKVCQELLPIEYDEALLEMGL